MRDDKVFIDTNILIYAFSSDDKEKQEIALAALDDSQTVISTQVIKELTSVFIKKKSISLSVVRDTLHEIIDIAEVISENVDLTFHALDIHEKYGFSFYDSLIIASAIEANCDILLSEDMQNGQIVEGKVKIVNPFKN